MDETKFSDSDWDKLSKFVVEQFAMEPDITAVLFLVGVQELGKGYSSFGKTQKMELIHIGTCRLLSKYGYYLFKGRDKDNWPVWELVKPLPSLKISDQETLLKQAAIEYFREAGIL